MSDLRTKTLRLRDLILATLNNYTVYYGQAPESAKYPYAVIEVRPYNTTVIPHDGIMEINVWDSYKTHSRADALMDNIEATLGEGNYYSDTYASFRAFSGQRQYVEDNDKQIKRVREQFQIRFNY